jgi:CDP-diacylglycerol--glycerol-3-phosphate 3-phosphatidyltransferase
MAKVDRDVRPRLEPERTATADSADREQVVDPEDVAPPGLAPRDPVELAQLLERIDAHVRVGADAELDAAVEDALDGEKAVAEVRLRRRAGADTRSGRREQVELVPVRVRRVDDRRARAEAAARVEQFDRPQPVLGLALLDLARLLVRMDVQRQLVLGGVGAELLEPVARTGADGVGGDADADSCSPQLLQLAKVGGDRFLAEARDPAARVGDVQEDELDSGLGGCLGSRASLLEPEVVELAHGRVADGEQLTVDAYVLPADTLRRLGRRQLHHRLAPGPEVAALGPAAQGALERVAVGVDETRDPGPLGHTRILSHMEARAVPQPLAQIPNALTVARLGLIPIFVVLMVKAGHNPSWPAGVVFGIAGITDQVDGFLARRWHVESRFGKIADPLADRLMIDAAVILLVAYDRLPWAGLVIIIGRDVLLLAGARFLNPGGIEVEVNTVGKAATWILYAAIFFRIVTHPSTQWPLVLFWVGLGLALVAGVFYVQTAWRDLRR